MVDRMGALAESVNTAMVVVTTASGGNRAGCLVGFHSQSSIHPPRYAVWLSKANRTYEVALSADVLAVHFLAANQQDLAEHFGGHTGDEEDPFAGIAWSEGPGGVPLLDGCASRLSGSRTVLVDEGGDHVCIVIAVDDLQIAPGFEPLRFCTAEAIEPGHDPDERRTT